MIQHSFSQFLFRSLLCVPIACLSGSILLANEIDFDRDVKPILSDKCFHCHGPDEATRAADLRLDTREGMFGDHSAFVPGEVDESEALRRVLSDDPDERMPPPDSKLNLSDRQKQTLRDWIAAGAKWSEHWSFLPPSEPVIPGDDSGWARGDLDRFVVARAKAAGLVPQGDASRETLIRRLTLDLTGLPPTIEELDAFLADRSDDAYEKVVDRLMASPRYGERMAWEWMDAARYADTDGFQGDPTRTMWPWRDWLVNALNRNMPFDQFTIEMLAGDLIPDATAEQILATGFNRNHMFNGEGGRIPEETRVENVFDRCETTGTVWLGLTMTCCRCHDHKYDPISQQEYFRLYAFFDNTSEDGRSGRGKTAPVLQYMDPSKGKKLDDAKNRLREVEKELAAPDSQIDARQAEWEAKIVAQLKANPGSSELGNWWQLGPVARNPRKAFDDTSGPEKGVDLEASVGDQQWIEKPGLPDGKVNALPDTIGVTYFYRAITTPTDRRVQLSLGSDDAIKVYVNGSEVLANYASRPAAADQEKIDVQLRAGSNDLLIKIVNSGGIAGMYFRKTSESNLGLPPELVEAMTADKRSPEQVKSIREHYRSQNWDRWKSLASRRDALRKERDQLSKQSVTVMVMDDLVGDRKRTTYVLERGGYDKPTDVSVQANTPAVLPPLPTGETPSRLTLARWLVDLQNPLTARVTVNRYWQTFFGRGLVSSTEDFGSQGVRPTHPELLDWLAIRFVLSGWDVKSLHKTIVMSSTYRQSSRVTESGSAIDPENKWLARGTRFRMPSWMLRDQALATSGLMNPALGGPSVMPYQPEGIWSEATFGKIKYNRDKGDKLYRRSLYVFWRRIVGPTMFFDGAKRQTCEVKPTRTNTPLHALTTLNETAFVESSRALAQRIMQSQSSQSDRLSMAFRLLTSRHPDASELAILNRRTDLLRDDFSNNLDEAKSLLNVGDSPRDDSLDVAEHAAYTMVCSLMLNLDEVLSRQ